ncbi:hypothetical protein Tco_0788363 [Tanacetum coccineum]
MVVMSHHIRERTDALDAAGNTTAAIGKLDILMEIALYGILYWKRLYQYYRKDDVLYHKELIFVVAKSIRYVYYTIGHIRASVCLFKASVFVNALGAGAGTIFLHCPLPISRSSSEQKEASYMTGPLFLNAVMELNLTSLVQDIFLVSRSSNDHQLQHYATWAVLFIKHYIWSSDRSNEDRESNSSSQSVPDD